MIRKDMLLHEKTQPRGLKTFFMLSSTEHENLTAHSNKLVNNKDNFFALKLLDIVFILLINVKMPTTVGILTFMSRINFMPI